MGEPVALHKTRARRINTLREGDYLITRYGTIMEIVSVDEEPDANGDPWVWTSSGKFPRMACVPTMRVGCWIDARAPEAVRQQKHVQDFLRNPHVFLEQARDPQVTSEVIEWTFRKE